MEASSEYAFEKSSRSRGLNTSRISSHLKFGGYCWNIDVGTILDIRIFEAYSDKDSWSMLFTMLYCTPATATASFMLVNYSHNYNDYAMWNPSTGDTKLIPNHPYPHHFDGVVCGIWFDSKTNEYKPFFAHSSLERKGIEIARRILYANGIPHWIGFSGFLDKLVIISFDMSNDKILTTPFPDDINFQPHPHHMLFNESLALVNHHCQRNGEISPSICNLSSLHILALSSSNLGGKLPPCLGNFSSMSMLKLYGNNFCGSIPDTWTNNCRMRVMDLSENQFQGHFPRSLANCTLLELLDIKKNQIEDSFPFWLETLPELFALFMSSNRFHGAIGEPQSKVSFPKLQIIDLSHNNFSGHLPWGYFQQWNAMKVFDNTHELTYLNGSYCGKNWTLSFFYSMKVTNKGIVLDYGKIPDFLKMMDLSNNRFEGDIPELIGNLKGLSSLNISNNILTGPIPSSLGNLSYLEVLDLSHNKLSGEIPLQLTQLNFLGSFSVANNNLTGAIPQGKQFDTFPNSSFEGNMGLFGSPLSNKYGNSEENSPPDPSPTVQEEEEESVLELDWKAVVIGCGCGIVIGIVVGHFVIEYKHDWFVETYGIWKRKQG
nr:receptor like protein 22-like [Ziziphus jujuba var. spinosa]